MNEPHGTRQYEGSAEHVPAPPRCAGYRDTPARHGGPVRAEKEKRYLKSPHAFLGVTMPQIHRLTRTVSRALRDTPLNQVMALCDPLWARRASLLSHIPGLRRQTADTPRGLATCRALLHEKEFFIRKAIGWTLREMSRTDPASTHRFLLAHRNQASGLTLREGSRHLPPHLCDDIMGSSPPS